MNHELALLKGFLMGGGLIIAIGAQNAYVLTQGVQRHYPGVVATTCFVVDALLITAGLAGMGALIHGSGQGLTLITLGGAMFLSAYGLRALWSAYRGGALARVAARPAGKWSAVVTCLALSLLNPHVYLDTVVLLGSVGGVLALPERLFFGAGAVLASAVWFYSLAFGAAYLAPILQKDRAWRVLELLIALIMFGIAAELWRRFYLSL